MLLICNRQACGDRRRLWNYNYEMAPIFPTFKKLTLSDKTVIESFTHHYPPYSDYYFFSLWSYDIHQSIRWSILNNNLIVQFENYTGPGMFLSFLGQHDTHDTLRQLFAYASSHALPPELNLIPAHNFINTPISSLSAEFQITEDPNNDDYILSAHQLNEMNGPKLYEKKKQLHKFQRLYPNARIAFHHLPDSDIHEKIHTIIRRWEDQTVDPRAHNDNESKAIKRTLMEAGKFHLIAACVYIDDEMRGFEIVELVNESYLMASFQKADKSYAGIFEYLTHEIAVYALKYGRSHINIEQDLGVPGLRQAKRKYNPTYLKKYTITRKANS